MSAGLSILSTPSNLSKINSRSPRKDCTVESCSRGLSSEALSSRCHPLHSSHKPGAPGAKERRKGILIRLPFPPASSESVRNSRKNWSSSPRLRIGLLRTFIPRPQSCFPVLDGGRWRSVLVRYLRIGSTQLNPCGIMQRCGTLATFKARENTRVSPTSFISRVGAHSYSRDSPVCRRDAK